MKTLAILFLKNKSSVAQPALKRVSWGRRKSDRKHQSRCSKGIEESRLPAQMVTPEGHGLWALLCWRSLPPLTQGCPLPGSCCRHSACRSAASGAAGGSNAEMACPFHCSPVAVKLQLCLLFTPFPCSTVGKTRQK